ncbi:iron chaperone [Solitalea koreensis]|uniref:Uncharacterized conserved protein YdhG, YjbR/CyaY-like superfamily, DUF1801 family n=1 Tax=Solitalea koreensis TaxID=543615 RepID=A0A521AYP6_9SPHI|nr:DUF1801 domain-containing protein [Solitalea koreensis]SMO39919.1 Uncharacterized conserved protein YdhG, YjbR/CyaY-like superfamily, DUF1801 family [Solitalea koreensis]
MTKPADVNEYIASFPVETQQRLEQMRAIIQEAAPQAKEVISYSMPAFKLNKMLVYFAGYKNHIGFYPTSSGISAFKQELSIYKNAKGSVQFPLDQPLPVDLIARIVKFRIDEDLQKARKK